MSILFIYRCIGSKECKRKDRSNGHKQEYKARNPSATENSSSSTAPTATTTPTTSAASASSPVSSSAACPSHQHKC